MIPSRHPHVFTIPPSADFLPTLARALLDGRLIAGFAPRDPFELARVTIYLPTRRACRLAHDAFLSALGVDAAVLPRITPIGDIDEDEFIFADESLSAAGFDLPETIKPLDRRVLLAQLILKWSASRGVRTSEGAPLVAQSPAAALALADDLAHLMDDMTTRQVPWEKLNGLVPENLDVYWQHALNFLNIAHEWWPALLKERDAIEPAERRDLLIAAEAERLRAAIDSPVIIAGSTGSMPATAKLIATIAALPHGAAVLPGLDIDLDEPSWQLLAGSPEASPLPTHPQFAMQALLGRIGIERRDVAVLSDTTSSRRELLVSEALRPAASTDLWRRRLSDSAVSEKISGALDGIAVIEAANADEEAVAIGVALRETLEQPGKTAALVTPDRALARRVAATLGRWNVTFDDSGGDPMIATPAGVFARLAATVALGGAEPVPLLALLKHPLLRLGRDASLWNAATFALERAVLRGARPKPGIAALKAALATARAEWEKFVRKERSSIYPSDPQARLTRAEFDAAAELVDVLLRALAPLESLAAQRKLKFGQFAAAHAEVLTALSSSEAAGDVFSGDAGTALARLFEDITAIDPAADLAISASDYTEMFETVAAGRIVRRPGAPGARVRIYGLLEARLTHADRVVLGGLVEGTWPPETRNDPWLSRPMRRTLGLDLPERRIGLAAHDFAQLFGAKEIVLTRAAKLAGAPTIASRFVQRLEAVAGESWKAVTARGENYLALARKLDQPETQPRPIERPAPTPPRSARPSSLSVTEIETWLRDPYAIYARHILDLHPLEPIDEPPGARDRGTMIHAAIGEFAESCKEALPDDAVGKLIALGETFFEPLKDHPEARAFWWPRFLRIAQWFVGFEAERRTGVKKLDVEISGRLQIPAGDRTFTLRTRADRIEHLLDGRFALLDYKTGTTPTPPQVKSGLSPQLTLEGAILRQGGFESIAAGGSIAEFMYVTLRGGEPAGIGKPIGWNDSTPDMEADKALRKLTELVQKFEDEQQPYFSRVTPMFIRRGGGDYDHLARIKEWSLTGGPDDDVGAGE